LHTLGKPQGKTGIKLFGGSLMALNGIFIKPPRGHIKVAGVIRTAIPFQETMAQVMANRHVNPGVGR